MKFKHSLVNFIKTSDDIFSNFVSVSALQSFLVAVFVIFALAVTEIRDIAQSSTLVIKNPQLCHVGCIECLIMV